VVKPFSYDHEMPEPLQSGGDLIERGCHFRHKGEKYLRPCARIRDAVTADLDALRLCAFADVALGAVRSRGAIGGAAIAGDVRDGERAIVIRLPSLGGDALEGGTITQLRGKVGAAVGADQPIARADALSRVGYCISLMAVRWPDQGSSGARDAGESR
jgi:hypothetical protein